MKNKKLISSCLCLFILILSFSSFINQGYAQTPNIELISEAEITTRWDFVNETAGFETLYYEPFDNASSYWNLYDVSQKTFQKFAPNEINYLLDNSTYSEWIYSGNSYYIGDNESYPTGIYFYDGYWYMTGENYHKVWKYNPDWSYTGTSWDVSGTEAYPTDLYYHNGYWWLLGDETPNDVHKFYLNWTYTGTSYTLGGQDSNPAGICFYNGSWWMIGDQNNKVYKYASDWTYTGENHSVSTEETYPTGLFFNGGYWYICGYGTNYIHKYYVNWTFTGVEYNVNSQDGSPEGIHYSNGEWWMVGKYNDKTYEYYNKYTISKSYQGSGILYCQTNETETLTLRSPDDLNLTLQEGDKIEVKFNTSSTNRIDLNLRNNSIQQASYILSSQGNGDFSNRIKTFTLSSNMSIDQMEFTGIFVDTKNLIVDYVKVFRSYSETDSYYLAPYERRELIIPYPYNYIVEIYEHDDLKETKYITTSANLQTLIYERIDDNIVYINYFDANNEYLDFNDYITYVNYTLEDFTYNNKRLSSNILYVDKDTSIYFKIYDSFNALVKTYETYEETFIDIILDVYSLKIKNEYHDPIFYELKNIDTEIIKSGNIFSEEIIGYSIATGLYIFNYTKDGEEESVNIDFLGHQILVINSSKMCFLTYVNQKGEYQFFYNYKTYVDGSLIYDNVFYRDVGDNVSVEIKDLYDISVKNHSFIVQTEDNYVPIILTQYSLKVMNQQELFNHINITRDPNYYESPYYWSEWVAPGEIIKFNLFTGYYKINLTDNEGGSFCFYEYTLNGDDILLISSNNVLSQVIYNIANVNATIGNQITNVEINITNQNSQINNSIINVDINLGNINSTLGDMLVNLDVDITNVANNITSLYTFTNNSFINLGNDINVSFISIENNIIAINQSISNLIVGVSNDIYLINGTISTMISQLETNLLLMNVSIDTALFNLDTTLNQIGSNITSNYILLNNTLNLMDLNINDSRIAIINNLLLVNNTISTLISEVYSAVYMINNSIYTAVVDLGSYLSIINNTISGNLSIVLEQNEFLTELYRMTMFSELLNWTHIGYNISLIEAQIDTWEFINNYRNQSIQVFLKYQDKIENLTVSAQNTIEQYLPKEDVEYRLWSVAEEEYLNKWTPLPDNKTVDFGFYETEVPEVPTPILEESIFMWIIICIAIMLAYISYVVITKLIKRNKRRKYIQNQKRQNMGVLQRLMEDDRRKKYKRKRKKRR